MLNSLSLKLKLTILSAIPLLCIVFFSAQLIQENFHKSSNASQVNTLMGVAVGNSNLVHELQKERGLTAGYIGSKGDVSFKEQLKEQRKLTDAKVATTLNLSPEHEQLLKDANLMGTRTKIIASINQLATMRKGIDDLSIATSEAIGYYTKTNAMLLNVILEISNIA